MHKFVYFNDSEGARMKPHADDGDEFYSAADVDSLVQRLLKAWDEGIVMSSNKDGYANVISEIREAFNGNASHE